MYPHKLFGVTFSWRWPQSCAKATTHYHRTNFIFHLFLNFKTYYNTKYLLKHIETDILRKIMKLNIYNFSKLLIRKNVSLTYRKINKNIR